MKVEKVCYCVILSISGEARTFCISNTEGKKSDKHWSEHYGNVRTVQTTG
jgi:hypothetical protein